MPIRLHFETLKNAKQVNLSKTKGLRWNSYTQTKKTCREAHITRLSLTPVCYQGLESCGMLKAAETGATEAAVRYRPAYQTEVRLKGPYLQDHLGMARISTHTKSFSSTSPLLFNLKGIEYQLWWACEYANRSVFQACLTVTQKLDILISHATMERERSWNLPVFPCPGTMTYVVAFFIVWLQFINMPRKPLLLRWCVSTKTTHFKINQQYILLSWHMVSPFSNAMLQAGPHHT